MRWSEAKKSRQFTSITGFPLLNDGLWSSYSVSSKVRESSGPVQRHTWPGIKEFWLDAEISYDSKIISRLILYGFYGILQLITEAAAILTFSFLWYFRSFKRIFSPSLPLVRRTLATNCLSMFPSSIKLTKIGRPPASHTSCPRRFSMARFSTLNTWFPPALLSCDKMLGVRITLWIARTYSKLHRMKGCSLLQSFVASSNVMSSWELPSSPLPLPLEQCPPHQFEKSPIISITTTDTAAIFQSLLMSHASGAGKLKGVFK